LTFPLVRHTVSTIFPSLFEVTMKLHRVLPFAALAAGLLMLVACAEPPPPKPVTPPKPAGPAPISADEVGKVLRGALGDAGFDARLAEVDGRIKAVKAPAEAQAAALARDRLLTQVFLTGTATPKACGFAAKLAGGTFDEAAWKKLQDLMARDAKLKATLAPRVTVVEQLRKGSFPIKADRALMDGWLRDRDPLMVGLRLYAARLMAAYLDQLLAHPEALRWRKVLADFGPMLAPKLAALAGAKEPLPVDTFFGPANSLYYCPEALNKLDAAAAPSALTATRLASEGCDARFSGITDAALFRRLAGSSSVVLHAYLSALHHLSLVPYVKEPDPFTKAVQDELKPWREGFDLAVYPLTLPYWTGEAYPAPAAKDEAKEAAAKPETEAAAKPAAKPAPEATAEAARPEAYEPSAAQSLAAPQQPLIVITLAEDGLYLGVRPLLRTIRGSYHLAMPEDAFPGQRLIELEPLLEAIKQRAAKPEAFTEAGGLRALVDAVAGLRVRIEPALERLHASVDRKALLDDRVLVLFAFNADKRLLPAIFSALVEVGLTRPQLVVARTHTPFGAPVVLDGTEGAKAVAALTPAPSHQLPLLVLAQRGDKVVLYPPDGALPKASHARAQVPELPKEAQKVLDPKKNLYQLVIDARLPALEDVVAAAAAWTQGKGKASPRVRLGAIAGGDLTLLPHLANVLGGRLEPDRMAGLDEALGVKGAACLDKAPCLGSAVLFDPAPRAPQMAAAGKPGKVKESRPMGFCAKGNIAKVVKARMGAIKFCYEKELQTYPDLQGKVTMKWTIEEDGSISSVGVASDTLKNKRVIQCMRHTVKKLRFDKPQGGTCVIRWPFVFNP
jgi:hypothetical protein